MLFGLLNVDEPDIPLLRTWLVDALFHDGSKVILSINGEQGTAKTTPGKVLLNAIDPTLVDLRSPPRTEHDLMIAGSNSWVLAYDNLSSVQPWFSDALCRISTGGGLVTRKLYTDSEQITIAVRRPVIMTGINALAERGDLIDRVIEIDLRVISDHQRKLEEDFWIEFNSIHPVLLGSILDGVSAVLRELPNTNAKSLPRMADFARRGIAAEKAMNRDDNDPSYMRFGTFIDSYRGKIDGSNESALENNLIGIPITLLMDKSPFWEGTSTDLLKALKNVIDESTREHKTWKELKPNQVGRLLKRVAPNLRKKRIEVERKHRNIRLQKLQ